MYIKRFSFGILLFAALTANGMAAGDLETKRIDVIHRYIADLQQADYQDITQLFEKNGTVISTSRGNVNAKDFFYSFLPNIESANTKLHQSFSGLQDKNHYVARFHFTFKLKDGETGNGEYMDEFIFSDQSTKLSAVYMFENLKFEN